jgi:hypothetical protein
MPRQFVADLYVSEGPISHRREPLYKGIVARSARAVHVIALKLPLAHSAHAASTTTPIVLMSTTNSREHIAID